MSAKKADAVSKPDFESFFPAGYVRACVESIHFLQVLECELKKTVEAGGGLSPAASVIAFGEVKRILNKAGARVTKT